MSELNNFYSEIKDILTAARKKAYSAVNFTMVEAYWLIGKRIIEEEQNGADRAEYGEYLIKNLSIELKNDLGKGFSVANLKNFRQFYRSFPDFEKSYALCSQLSWSHFRLIMRVENEKARNYYLTECSEQRWSTRVLERNINSFYYERLLSSQEKQTELSVQKNFEKTSHKDFIKDPYVLEFLGLPEKPFPGENTIENSIIENIKDFLLEMGSGFSFVGRQFRISSETKHFYIDLVFYNYLLKCFVLIDLKTAELTHQDVGQMDMYVRMFDDLKRQSDDNPTLGIILCSHKDETIVRYSVLKGNEQLFASKYRLVLPSEEELAAELGREMRLIEEKRGLDNE
jgi:predicted nuclease of restriction endonuclease-like (RecB) superfamily